MKNMLRYWIWLSCKEHIGNKKKIQLLEHLGSPDAVYRADEITLANLGILSQNETESLMDKNLEEAEEILYNCEQKRISLVTFSDSSYPQRLKNIADPPLILYYEGRLPNVDATATIAMVGTRKASAYGMKQAKELAYQLGRGGAIVVSGSAVGIDTTCLEGALTSGTSVISVLGNGTDIVYPSCNKNLYEDIRNHGCLLSEFPPGTQPLPQNFPRRNRIISGLALGVLVVEAPIRSGALITARLALEQGKDVFTIPANLGTVSCKGNFRLLKDGAIPVEDGSDILKEYVGIYPVSAEPVKTDFSVDSEEPETTVSVKQETKKIVDKKNAENYIDLNEVLSKVTPDGALILKSLCQGPMYVDEIVETSKLSASRVLSAITILEIKHLIKRLPGKRFVLAENIRAGEHHE